MRLVALADAVSGKQCYNPRLPLLSRRRLSWVEALSHSAQISNASTRALSAGSWLTRPAVHGLAQNPNPAHLRAFPLLLDLTTLHTEVPTKETRQLTILIFPLCRLLVYLIAVPNSSSLSIDQ